MLSTIVSRTLLFFINSWCFLTHSFFSETNIDRHSFPFYFDFFSRFCLFLSFFLVANQLLLTSVWNFDKYISIIGVGDLPACIAIMLNIKFMNIERFKNPLKRFKISVLWTGRDFPKKYNLRHLVHFGIFTWHHNNIFQTCKLTTGEVKRHLGVCGSKYTPIS